MKARRGAALILVVVVIAALLAIAAPFVFSMRLHERSSRGFAAEVEAQAQADAARAAAIVDLMRTHPDEERREREARGVTDQDPEGIDTLDELRPGDTLAAAAGLRPFSSSDPRGAMAWAEVWDVRGRIDLNASGPDPIANLLGVTLTTAEVSYEEHKRIPVESTADFFSDGDPRTIDGVVKIGGEFIAYRHTTPTELLLGEETDRGFFFSRSPPPDEPEAKKRYIPEGTLVQDMRGWKVAADPLWRQFGTARQGELARFDSTAAIRRIADWEYGTLRAALVLWRYGVTMDRLRQWGVGQDLLEQAGLDARDFDKDVNDEKMSPAEKDEVRTAERQLREWGLTLQLVRRGGGDRAVLRVWRHLQGLTPAQRDKTVAAWRQRAEQEAAQLQRVEGWLKSEVRRQLEGLTEMRDETPGIETIGRIELEEKIRPFVTTDSPVEGESWSDPLVVTHRVQYDPYDWAARIQVQDGRRFQPGMVVRLRPRDGRPPEYRTCMDVNGRRSGKDVVVLFPQLDLDYEANELDISCRQPRPINVNTAPREVLQAVLTGLQCRVGQRARGRMAPLVVTPAQARAIAEAIVAEPPANHQALRALLLDLRSRDVIDDHAVEAVGRNAIDPADQLLERSTAPFCYASGDVYEVTATGVVNDPAGNELARHRYRQVVRVAPPRELTWHIDSQADFTDRVWVGGPMARGEQPLSGLHEMFLPGRWANHLQSRPALLGPFAATPWAWPSRSHAPGEGDIQPLGSREKQNLPAGQRGARAGVLQRQDYDGQLEGVDLAGGVPRGQLGSRNQMLEDQTTIELVGPSMLRGWFRLDALPAGQAKAFLFDGGTADRVDRLSLYVQAGGLVLEAWDEALDVRETSGNPRSTRVAWYPDPAAGEKPLQAGNWYHVAAFWKGSDRNDLALCVDGRFVGRQQHGSRLAADIDAYTTSIPVEDPDRFPPQGWIRIGASRCVNPNGTGDRGIFGTDRDTGPRCEVLHYVKNGSVLEVDHRSDYTAERQRLQGKTITQVRDVTASGEPPPAVPPPASARRPERGSGRRVQVTYAAPRQPNQPQPAAETLELAVGYAHAAGTMVVPYGYTSRVRSAPSAAPGGGPATGGFTDRIRLGGAVLAHPLLRNMPVTVLYKPIPGYDPRIDPFPVVLDATATQIPVLWAGPWPDAPQGRASTAPNADPNLVGGWPPRGVVRIGDERIYYEGLLQTPDGTLLQNCVRGFMGTTPAAHRLAKVVALESILVTYPPGYGNAPDDHYRPRPTLADPHSIVSIPRNGANDVEWLSVQPALPQMDPRIDLIARGVMLVPLSDAIPTPVRNDPIGDPFPIDLRSVLLNIMVRRDGSLGQNPGSQPIDAPGNPPLVQADLENGVLWKEALKRRAVRDPNRNLPWRAEKGTAIPVVGPGGQNGHAVGTPLIPTFLVRDADDQEAGRDDVVTVTDDQQGLLPREERVIAHGADAQVGRPGDPGRGWLVAFTEDVSRLYEGSAHARLHRWPTGTLSGPIDLVLGRARPPQGPGDLSADAPGTLRAKVDDLVTMQLEERVPPAAQLRRHLGPADVGLGPVPGGPNQWREGSLQLLDDEVVGVVDAAAEGNGSSNLTLLRGALGGPVGPRNPGARPQSGETVAWRLPWPPVAVAQGGTGGVRGELVPIRGGDEFRDKRVGGGFMAIERGRGRWAGVWPYVDLDRGALRRPVDLEERGTFPFAFGSDLTTPAANDLLVDLPFRAHDRYAPRTSSLQGVFFQAAKELGGAFVTSVEWDEQLPDPYCEVKVALRLDGDPGWDAEPATAPGQAGRLYLFDDPRRANEVMLRAERVELRVYITFKPGALYNDAWKRAAVVGAVRVKYRQPLRVLRHEERVD